MYVCEWLCVTTPLDHLTTPLDHLTHGMCSSSSESSGSLRSGCATVAVRASQALNTLRQEPATSSFRQVT